MAQSFAQLSDLHLSTLEGASASDLLNKRALGYLSWRRKRRFEHRLEVLEALREDINLDTLDQVLLTGDLTHVGLPAEFDQCLDWLQKLGDPGDIALVPGNHDACVAAPWPDTFAKWEPYMASDNATVSTYPSLRVRGDIAFIGLSTGCPKPPLMATGTLGPAQLERLPEILERSEKQGLFRVVFLHHSPVAGHEKWRKRLTDANQIQRLLESHGAELVLHGHGHRAHYTELHTCAGTLPVFAVPSASALGAHGADVAAYNCYQVERTVQGWHLAVNVKRYDVAENRFTNAEHLDIPVKRERVAG